VAAGHPRHDRGSGVINNSSIGLRGWAASPVPPQSGAHWLQSWASLAPHMSAPPANRRKRPDDGSPPTEGHAARGRAFSGNLPVPGLGEVAGRALRAVCAMLTGAQFDRRRVVVAVGIVQA
jgi:hypothetical protein